MANLKARTLTRILHYHKSTKKTFRYGPDPNDPEASVGEQFYINKWVTGSVPIATIRITIDVPETIIEDSVETNAEG